MKNRGVGSNGAKAWFYQRVTGVFLVIILLFHFYLMHAQPPKGELNFDTLRERLSDPNYQMLQILFLFAALSHSITGLIMVIHDYIHTKYLRILTVTGVWLTAISLFVFGVLTVITIK